MPGSPIIVTRGLLSLSSLLLLVGCTQPDVAPPAHHETRINYSQIDEPRKLDPAFVKDLYEGIVSGFLYDGLTRFGTGAEIEPALAERWDISDDGRIYTFHLRDTRFSNGQPVTADDVRYSFTRILHPETGSDRKWVLDRIVGAQEVTSGTARDLAGLETPDAQTVRITLKQPYPVFLTMLAMPNAAIIPKDSAGTGTPDIAFNESPIGSGPWMLDKWLHDQRLEFVPNSHYWGVGPHVQRLVYQVQVEDTVRRRQWETGNFDIYQVGFQMHEAFMSNPRLAALTTSVQELRTDYVGVMCSKPALADTRVRQAIAMAINRPLIFERLQKSRGVLAHSPVPPSIPGYRERGVPHAYAPDQSRALLQQTGNTGLKLDLWFRQEPLNSEMANAIQNDLREVGIEVTLVPRDQAALRSGIHEGQADLFLGSWTLDYPDIENALYPPFHSRNIPRQGNQTHFRNSEVDTLLDAARAEVDPDRRLQVYQAVEDKVREECPWIPLFHRRSYYTVQPHLRNWQPALMYNVDRFNEVSLQAD